MPFKFNENKDTITAILAVLILIVLPIVLLISHYAGDGFLGDQSLLYIWLWVIGLLSVVASVVLRMITDG